MASHQQVGRGGVGTTGLTPGKVKGGEEKEGGGVEMVMERAEAPASRPAKEAAAARIATIEEQEEEPLSSPPGGTSFLAPKMTSMRVFRNFMRRVPDPHDSSNTIIDAADIVSRACYEMWCTTRSLPLSDDYRAAKTFQRALTGHLSATDGRLPFSPEEEAAVLKVVRVKQVWPCFIGTSHVIGAKGFRSKGFHERQLSDDPESAGPEPNRKRSSTLPSSDRVQEAIAGWLQPQIESKKLKVTDQEGGPRPLAPPASAPVQPLPPQAQASSSVAPMRFALPQPYSSVFRPDFSGIYPMWMPGPGGMPNLANFGAPRNQSSQGLAGMPPPMMPSYPQYPSYPPMNMISYPISSMFPSVPSLPSQSVIDANLARAAPINNTTNPLGAVAATAAAAASMQSARSGSSAALPQIGLPSPVPTPSSPTSFAEPDHERP